MLFDVFFERIHTRWPLLDRVVYTKLFEKQYTQGALSIIERSIFHLIYSITARFLSLTRKPCGVDYEVSQPNQTMLRYSHKSSTISLRQQSQWTIFWINTTLRLSSFSFCLGSMASGLLTEQVPGLRSGMLHRFASRWACIGREAPYARPSKQEMPSFAIEHSGHAIVSIELLALCLVVLLLLRIETLT